MAKEKKENKALILRPLRSSRSKRTQLIVRWNKEKKLDVLGLSVRGESYRPWKTKQYIICRKLIKSTLRFWGTKRLFHPNF